MRNLIVISDDHPLFRQALRETIEPIFKQAEIIELESLEETKTILAEREVELLLLDLRMPDSQGLTGLMMIKGTYPALPVIIVSASEEAETVRSAIQAGASGYIYKSYSLKQIHDAVAMVNQGEVHIPDEIDGSVTDHEHQDLDAIAKISSLTPMQLKVFLFLSEGLMNKQIAAEMDISEATVKAHVTSIYKKLGVRSRTQAVMVSKALD
ncbi:MAG: response regulator transcription factor [Arenicellales bacterium]